jgi:hypothetical protein
LARFISFPSKNMTVDVIKHFQKFSLRDIWLGLTATGIAPASHRTSLLMTFVSTKSAANIIGFRLVA